MEYRFYTPKQRLQRLEATLREFETKHFLAVMNARNSSIAGDEAAELAGVEQAAQLDKAYARTLAEYETLDEEIKAAAMDEAEREVEA